MELKKIIICVDDEKIILDSLKGQLRRKFGTKYKYSFAESAAEGIELITELRQKKHTIHAVISDWLMPNMKGDEFLSWVNDESPSTKKILLTGHVDNEVVKLLDCCNNERINCIYKPWNEDELFLLIEN